MIKTMADEEFWTKNSFIQIGYAIWANLSLVAIGLAMAFPAVAIPQLIEEDSIVPVTVEEESWIASVLTLCSPIGCIFCGMIMDRYGRRIGMVLCHIPMVLGWICVGLAKSPRQIIIGRLITGIGIGMTMGPPRLFSLEMCLPKMRGVIGAFPGVALSFGITIQAILGSYLKWWQLCYVSAGYTTMLIFSNMCLPETPYYVLLKGTTESAKRSLSRFRAKNYDIDTELQQLIEFKSNNDIQCLSFKESLQQLFTYSACKPFSIITIYMFIVQGSGVTVMIMWTLDVLEMAHTNIDAHMGNFILGLTKIISAISVSFLLYRIGRRPMALCSGVGVGTSCVMISIYLYVTDKKSAFPMICFIMYVVTASMGYYTLPQLMMVELYPLQVRGLLGGISMSILNFLIFITNFIYPHLRIGIGFANTILLFGVCSWLGVVYIYFNLPETKGLSLKEIEEKFNRRPTDSNSIVERQNDAEARYTAKAKKKGKEDEKN